MFKSNKAEALNMFANMAAEAAALKLNKVTVRGDSAEIDFGDGKPGSESKQSLRVVLAKGEWKLAQ
jgi:phage tail tube protein FII